MNNISRKEEISIYIHWPFCKSKCPYCDFNSHVRSSIDENRWQKAYLKEIEYYKDILKNKYIKSIFFGGGTPSLAPTSIINSIIDALSPNSDTEITLEANPTSIEASRFRDYKLAGVNRVSIGVQSLNPDYLKFLGREHSAKEALQAIELAKKYFDRYSFDLIYMLPNQSLSDWEKELTQALKFTAGHMSLYQLTIEKGTKFFSMYKKNAFTLPNDDTAADAYMLTNAIMEENRLPFYEVSNYAALGQECKHNLTYWKYQDYIGIGAGAHGRYACNQVKMATVNSYSPEEWLKNVEEKGNGLRSYEALSSAQEYEERIIMGLRLREGIEIGYFKNIEQVNSLIKQGLLQHKDNNIRATQQGILVLNSIINSLY